MRTSSNGLRLIEQFEGFVSHIYYDAVGVATVGFGTTSADISPLPVSVTRAQAEALLKTNLEHKYEPAVNSLGVQINQNQFDALVSLAYNCGPGAMQWQIGRDVRAHNFSAAADDFMRYVYAGGHVLQGLVNRRRAERMLFLTRVDSPYDMFPDQDVLPRINERMTVKQVDGALQHPSKYHDYLKGELYSKLKKLRDRIWTVAHLTKPAAWDDSRMFGARWQAINSRMKAISKL